MTPEELAAEQEQADRDRAWQLFDARAKQLVGDVGGSQARLRSRKLMAERCRKSWPKLSDDEVEATIDRAQQIADEMAARRLQLEIESRTEREARSAADRALRPNDESTTLATARTEMTTTTMEMTTERAIELARELVKERPLISGAAVHRELKAQGYEPTYQAFYASIWKQVRPTPVVLQGDAPAEGTKRRGRPPKGTAPTTEEETSAGAADPEADRDVTPSEPEPPAGAVVAETIPAPSRPSTIDPAAGSGTFLILGLQATRHDGGTRLTATIDADGDVGDAITNFTRRLRGAAAA